MQQLRRELEAGKFDPKTVFTLYFMQYIHSWAIRGDNAPEFAKYLEFILAKDLYPDLEFVTYRTFFREVLDGEARKPYSVD